MRLEKTTTILSGSFLGFLVSFGAVSCLATAFSLHTGEGGGPPVELSSVALWCILLSAVASGCYSWKLGAVPICLLAFAGGYLWRQGTLEKSIEALCYTVSIVYDRAYHFGYVSWSGENLRQVDRTAALCVVAVPLVLSTVWTVCRKRRAVWAILAGILPIFACTLVTDRVPEVPYLVIWLLGLGILILTQTVRRTDARQGNVLTALVSIPTALALCLLFWLVPQEEYQGQEYADALLQKLQSTAQWIADKAATQISGDSREMVDLTKEGYRWEIERPVMEVTADYSDTVYLRGRAYDVYTGTGWLLSQEPTELPWSKNGTVSGHLEVKTRFLEKVQYVPYYVAMPYLTDNPGGMENTQQLTEYRYTCMTLQSGERLLGNAQAIHALTELPEQTRQWANPLVQQILGDAYGKTTADAAGRIGRYVRGSASYSLNVGRMDGKYGDFAQWFLEESDTGYCVHFASATTVLLRAAGIPARYVTGYMVQTREGETVTVTGKQAHAWVEYWTPTSGWKVLESTAAEARPQVPETTPTEPTETQVPTEPEETQEQTRPTTPEESRPQSDPKPTGPKEEVQTRSLLWPVLGGIAAALALVIGQWRLRLWLKKRARTTGTTNARALATWQQLLRLWKILGMQPEKELLELAQKAKFSQHALTREELNRFMRELLSLQEQLRKRGRLRSIVYGLVYACC